MKRWKAKRFYIRTGQQTIATFDALTREQALEQVNSWNRSLPGVWMYWLIGTGREV